MYELAFVENGHLVRGGIKAPLLTVEKWLEEVKAVLTEAECVIAPASPEAVTKEELYAQLDEFYGRRHGNDA